MAVEDVLPWIAVEPGADSCLLSRAKIDGFLPPVIKPPRPFRTAVQNLEMHKMQVDRMMEVAVQSPDLDPALVRRGVNVVDGERFTVDRPAVMTIDRLGPEDHVPLDRGLRRIERFDLREHVRHRGLVALGAHDAELHDPLGGALPEVIEQLDGLSDAVAGEVDDDLLAFRRG